MKEDSFSFIAAAGGVIGVLWLELVRISAKVRSRKKLWNGLRIWQYLALVAGFMGVAFAFAGFWVPAFLSGVVVGFGIEGGPVAMGVLSNQDGPKRQIEDGAGATSPRPSIKRFFTES